MNLARPSYEELQAEVLELRRELRLRTDEQDAAQFSLAFKLTPNEARVLLGLYRAQGKAVRRHHLLDLTERLDILKDITDQVCDVYVCRLRKVLDEGAIQTVRGFGWKLTPIGLDACKLVLAS